MRCQVAPVRSDGADRNPVARLEQFHVAADLIDCAYSLMSKGEVLAGSDCAADRVGVGGADQRCRRLYDGVIGSASGMGFSMKPTKPISFMTKVFIKVANLFLEVGYFRVCYYRLAVPRKSGFFR